MRSSLRLAVRSVCILLVCVRRLNGFQALPAQLGRSRARVAPNSRSRRSHLTATHRSYKSSDWLEQATSRLENSPPGSLSHGKSHEVISLFGAWSGRSKKDPQAPTHMENLIKRLIEENVPQSSQATAVSIDLYNKLLDSWACAALFRTVDDPKMASSRARQILVILQEQYEAYNPLVVSSQSSQPAIPNRESFEIVYHVVCRVEGPLIARRLLAWMEYLAKSGKNKLAQPTPSNYHLLLDAYANDNSGSKSSSSARGVLAESLLRHMISVGEVLPDALCYNYAMKAWGRRGRQSAEQVQNILETMQATPDVVSYGTAIAAWAASGSKAHAVERAEHLLKQMQGRGLKPNTVVWNAVMSAWVKSRHPSAVNRTAEILQHLEEEAAEHEEECVPDLISYNTHLHALSSQTTPHRSEYSQRAFELLERMEKSYDSGEVNFSPNLFSYNLLIDAYCRSQQGLAAAHMLRRLVQRGIDPDTYSFNQALTALAKTGHVGMAEKLLWYMDHAYQTGLHLEARPDVNSFASVIYAHSKIPSVYNAERAQQILSVMKERAAQGQVWLKPDRYCYNTVISAWATSGQGLVGARKAEALLQQMQMDANNEESSSISPNIITYNAVLNAWARSGTRCCGVKAETYLKKMWDLYNAGNEKVKPNDFSYNTVINAISKSKNEGKAQRALRLLRRMDKLYQAGNKEARPNEITYTAVLNSCAFPARLDPRTRRKALDTAIFTLEELRASRYGQPNQVTYGTFILACANLLLPEDDVVRRREIIERAFQQCCKDGQVGEMVLNHLRKAAPPDLYEELLSDFIVGARRISVADLPPEWRCNVQDKDRWGVDSRKSNSSRNRKSASSRRKPRTVEQDRPSRSTKPLKKP